MPDTPQDLTKAPSEPEFIEGSTTRLRLAQPESAPCLQRLPTEPTLSRHLSTVSGDVEAQRVWLELYKERKASGKELFYIIEALQTGQPCGTVRLYDIDDLSFTWGSWILDETKPPMAALDSAILSFGVGFDRLGRKSALVEVRRKSAHALAFYRRFGMIETRANDDHVYLECLPEHCRRAASSLRSALGIYHQA